jgi:two-component system response regulator
VIHEVEILLAEDSPSDAEMTIRALKKSNLANRLLHVKDGAEALDFIFSEGKYVGREGGYNPKVIILDLKMPKVNGIEVLQRLKSDKDTKNIPVVVLTSSKEDPDIEKCYELGVNSYIVKPVEFIDFYKVVSNLGLYWLIVNHAPNH